MARTSSDEESEGSVSYIRQDAYETPNYEKSKDDKTKKLKKELRKLSKSVHSYDLFSDEWRKMVLQLKLLAEACFDEATKKDDSDANNTNNPHGSPTVHKNIYDKNSSNNAQQNDNNNNNNSNHSGSFLNYSHSNNSNSSMSVHATDDNKQVIGLCAAQGTLWDNGKKVIGVRIILEEGKLNLILRLLTNFRELKRQLTKDEWNVKCENACNVSKIRMVTFKQLLETYEKSLGIILFFSLKYKETLQILDTAALIEHCASIIRNPDLEIISKQQTSMIRVANMNCHVFDDGKYQEWLILFYLQNLTSYFDSMDGFEEKTMHLFANHGLLSMVLEYCNSYHTVLSMELIATVIIFLDECFASESFTTESDIFYTHAIPDKTNNNDKNNDGNSDNKVMSSPTQFHKTVVLLHDNYLNNLLRSHVLDRKQVRHFQKQYRTSKRKAK